MLLTMYIQMMVLWCGGGGWDRVGEAEVGGEWGGLGVRF